MQIPSIVEGSISLVVTCFGLSPGSGILILFQGALAFDSPPLGSALILLALVLVVSG